MVKKIRMVNGSISVNQNEHVITNTRICKNIVIHEGGIKNGKSII